MKTLMGWFISKVVSHPHVAFAEESVPVKGWIATIDRGNWIETSNFYPDRGHGNPTWEKIGWKWQEVELQVRKQV